LRSLAGGAGAAEVISLEAGLALLSFFTWKDKCAGGIESFDELLKLVLNKALLIMCISGQITRVY
jgi:hypothetical protein